MNNTGFTPTNTTSSLFPPLDTSNNNNNSNDSNEQQQQQLLWNNVNTFRIPGDSESTTSSPPNNNNNNLNDLIYPTNNNNSPSTTATTSTTSSLAAKVIQENTKEDSTAFNISWGGDDKPPSELHPKEEQEQLIKLTRPLPKPRGIRKLPEPEPSEDGTIDEDTLKRRKNTDAARRSRMKKFLKVDQLETRVATLQAENAKLILSNAVLESEKRSLNAKENEYIKRIRYLEEIIKSNGWDFSTCSSSPSVTDGTF